MPKLIPLTQGKFAIVDDEDYELVNQHKWCAYKDKSTYYAMRAVTINRGVRITQRMHRFITGYKLTDHINRNGLDNRRENLREVTNLQNQMNTLKTSKKTSSIYKGVSWYPNTNKWVAHIGLKGKRKTIGYFDDEIRAAMAYDAYARYFHREFATYNFPKDGERSAI